MVVRRATTAAAQPRAATRRTTRASLAAGGGGGGILAALDMNGPDKKKIKATAVAKPVAFSNNKTNAIGTNKKEQAELPLGDDSDSGSSSISATAVQPARIKKKLFHEDEQASSSCDSSSSDETPPKPRAIRIKKQTVTSIDDVSSLDDAFSSDEESDDAASDVETVQDDEREAIQTFHLDTTDTNEIQHEDDDDDEILYRLPANFNLEEELEDDDDDESIRLSKRPGDKTNTNIIFDDLDDDDEDLSEYENHETEDEYDPNSNHSEVEESDDDIEESEYYEADELALIYAAKLKLANEDATDNADQAPLDDEDSSEETQATAGKQFKPNRGSKSKAVAKPKVVHAKKGGTTVSRSVKKQQQNDGSSGESTVSEVSSRKGKPVKRASCRVSRVAPVKVNTTRPKKASSKQTKPKQSSDSLKAKHRKSLAEVKQQVTTSAVASKEHHSCSEDDNASDDKEESVTLNNRRFSMSFEDDSSESLYSSEASRILREEAAMNCSGLFNDNAAVDQTMDSSQDKDVNHTSLDIEPMVDDDDDDDGIMLADNDASNVNEVVLMAQVLSDEEGSDDEDIAYAEVCFVDEEDDMSADGRTMFHNNETFKANSIDECCEQIAELSGCDELPMEEYADELTQVNDRDRSPANKPFSQSTSVTSPQVTPIKINGSASAYKQQSVTASSEKESVTTPLAGWGGILGHDNDYEVSYAGPAFQAEYFSDVSETSHSSTSVPLSFVAFVDEEQSGNFMHQTDECPSSGTFDSKEAVTKLSDGQPECNPTVSSADQIKSPVADLSAVVEEPSFEKYMETSSDETIASGCVQPVSDDGNSNHHFSDSPTESSLVSELVVTSMCELDVNMDIKRDMLLCPKDAESGLVQGVLLAEASVPMNIVDLSKETIDHLGLVDETKADSLKKIATSLPGSSKFVPVTRDLLSDNHNQVSRHLFRATSDSSVVEGASAHSLEDDCPGQDAPHTSDAEQASKNGGRAGLVVHEVRDFAALLSSGDDVEVPELEFDKCNLNDSDSAVGFIASEVGDVDTDDESVDLARINLESVRRGKVGCFAAIPEATFPVPQLDMSLETRNPNYRSMTSSAKRLFEGSPGQFLPGTLDQTMPPFAVIHMKMAEEFVSPLKSPVYSESCSQASLENQSVNVLNDDAESRAHLESASIEKDENDNGDLSTSLEASISLSQLFRPAALTDVSQTIVVKSELGNKQGKSQGAKQTINNSRRRDGVVKKWTLGSKIGSGAFGVVHVGMNTQTGALMAVKIVEIDETMVRDIRREINLLRNLEHQNIVRYYGAENVNGQLNIFQEWVAGGSITSMLAKFGAFPLAVVRNYLSQSLEGLMYLHDHKVMHRDIKGANILVSDVGIVKLADFGASKLLTSDMMLTHTMRGTPYFMAPEVFEEKYNFRADVWSIGCVAYQMFTSSPPWKHFNTSNPVALLNKVKNHRGPPPLDVPKSCTDKDHDIARFTMLLGRSFQFDPAKRPSAQEMLQDSFFLQGDGPLDDDTSVIQSLFSPCSVSTWASARIVRSPVPRRPSVGRANSGCPPRSPFLSPPLPKRQSYDSASPMRSPKPDATGWPAWAREHHEKTSSVGVKGKVCADMSLGSMAYSASTAAKTEPSTSTETSSLVGLGLV